MHERDNRPRAVFSTEDFGLLHKAVRHYVITSQEPDVGKYGNLLHRLGRVTPAGGARN